MNMQTGLTEPDTDEPTARIETNARIARPMLKPLLSVDGEHRVRADVEGLHVRVVDPANVFMLEQTMHRKGFNAYSYVNPDGESPEFTTGMRTEHVARALGRASMNITDPDRVYFDITRRRTQTQTRSDYDSPNGSTRMTDTQTVEAVDPGGLRENPDLPDIEPNLTAKAHVPPRLFRDAMERMSDTSDHVRISAEGGFMRLRAEGEHEDREIECGAIADDADETDGVSSLFSMGYAKKLAKALGPGSQGAKCTHLSVRWGDTYPVLIEYARHPDDPDADDGYADEPIYSGRALIAPRIQSEDDDEPETVA